ncbi:MAG: formimidoylglutamase [Blautia sp.]|uniref:formimidoylglutamase n=1 Tax=Blautia sp. TaxID=1955243 RepID=UPI002E761303|nr:formimidoylglutamase [Blautia sp.]MEE1442886.1 formimidoylglutamase [Blautia sp.]
MLLTNYVRAMDCWKGRIDSTTDYDAFRWHQWVQPLDLNEVTEPMNGRLGFAFIGFCSEQGVKRNKGRVGTALAPDFIRAQMSNFPCTFSQEVKFYDAGNILCDEISMEEGQRLLGVAVEKILDLKLFPIVLGGGHETTFGHFQGQLADLKKKKDSLDMGIINFDAHFDLRPYDNGPSSGSMFRQIADIYKKEDAAYHYLPLGIQEHSNTVSLFKYAKEIGADYILAKEIQNSNYSVILEKIDTFLYECDSAYITICTDVFSSAFAPGVSATQSLGLDPEVVLPLLKHILRTRQVRGFDICEISPRFDQDNTTANLGAVLIFAVVNTMCKLNNLAIDVLK